MGAGLGRGGREQAVGLCEAPVSSVTLHFSSAEMVKITTKTDQCGEGAFGFWVLERLHVPLLSFPGRFCGSLAVLPPLGPSFVAWPE